MNKYQTYSLLGKILALDIAPSHRELIIRKLQKGDVLWERFVALADHHLILQALYPKIRDHELSEYFPREVFAHLKYIFDLTTARNLEVISQAEKSTAVLRKESIIPLYMKGVGNILDGLYKYPGERILHDIDILVPEKSFEDAAGILIKDGYRSDYEYDPTRINRTRHYPILYKPGEPVYVELHRLPVGERYKKFFTSETVLGSAKHPSKYPDCLTMSDEHKIIHNFMHSQLDHQARIYAREFMRNLYDLLLLSGRKNPEQVFSDFGHFRRASSGYLDIAYDTFGVFPAKRKLPGFFIHFYRFRYKLNMKSRFAGVASLILLRVFLGYLVKPVKAITDRELRIKLMHKLADPEWYKKQVRYYRRVLGIRIKN